VNENAWKLIERVISESDYYVLIIGGRYGSQDDVTGLSYTQKEYELAVKLGIPVLAFLHRKPGGLSVDNSELDSKTRKKLLNFRKMVEVPHHCNYWESISDLNGLVFPALINVFETSPAQGWIRDTGESVEELNSRLVALQKKYDLANERLSKLDENSRNEHDFFKEDQTIELVISNDFLSIFDEIRAEESIKIPLKKATVTWGEIFVQIGGALLRGVDRYQICVQLGKLVLKKLNDENSHEYYVCTEGSFDAVTNQLGASNLIDCSVNVFHKIISAEAQLFGGSGPILAIWTLTETGKKKHFQFSARRLGQDSRGPIVAN